MTNDAFAPATPARLEAVLAAPVAVLFKHSTRCPLSARARAELTLARVDDVPFALVDVVAQRETSQALAERTAVPHASPQVLVLRAGQVVWHASHGRVTAAAVEEAVANALVAPPAAG